MKKAMRIIAGILVGIFVFWGASLAKCEFLTMIYGDMLQSKCSRVYDAWERIDEFKVIDWSPTTIKAYAVCDGGIRGHYVDFTRDHRGWLFSSYDVRWSKFGNASEDVLPYIEW